MNKKGITILELLISITFLGVIIIFLTRLLFSLDNVNNDKSYASSDEIKRAELIKNIESDFFNKKLQGLEINKNIITFNFETESKILEIEKDKIIYNGEVKTLESKNATYELCPIYDYTVIDNYYLVTINIPVLIDNKNETNADDIVLTYMDLIDSNTNYPETFICN